MPQTNVTTAQTAITMALINATYENSSIKNIIIAYLSFIVFISSFSYVTDIWLKICMLISPNICNASQ